MRAKAIELDTGACALALLVLACLPSLRGPPAVVAFVLSGLAVAGLGLVALDTVAAWVIRAPLPFPLRPVSAGWASLGAGAITALCPLAYALWTLAQARSQVDPSIRWSIGGMAAAIAGMWTVSLHRATRFAPARAALQGGLGRALLLAALALFGGFVLVHQDEATLSQWSAARADLRLGVYALSWLASVVLVPLLAWRWHTLSAGPPSARAARLAHGSTIALLCGLATVLLVLDRTQLVGLYPGFHLWLEVVGVLALQSSALLVLVMAPGAVVRLTRPLSALMLLGAGYFELTDSGRAPAFRAAAHDLQLGSTALALYPRAVMETALPRALLQEQAWTPYPAPKNTWNILLISIDTLRRDCLDPAGGRDAPCAAPKLAALAAQSAYFERAYTPGSRTEIALTGILFGRYSALVDWQLMIDRGGSFVRRDELRKQGENLAFEVGHTLPRFAGMRGLATRLREVGFRTMAVVDSGNEHAFARGAGFDQGFDQYVRIATHSAQDQRRRPAPTTPELLSRALAQIDHAAGARWFQWVHLFDPHESVGSTARYRELVTITDDGIAALLSALRTRNMLEHTAIVIVSDHGEAFGEHGLTVHANSLYEELIRVPLIVRLPGAPARRVHTLVSTLDITPTLLMLAGADARNLSGIELLSPIYAERHPPARAVFSELHKYHGPEGGTLSLDLKAIVTQRWKLIESRLKGAVWLFDLDTDPAELHSRALAQPQVGQALLTRLRGFINTAEREHPLPR